MHDEATVHCDNWDTISCSTISGQQDWMAPTRSTGTSSSNSWYHKPLVMMIYCLITAFRALIMACMLQANFLTKVGFIAK